MRRVVRLAVSVLAMAAARVSSAQELRGAVLDSARREPVSGAIIALLNANGTTLGRNITDERGRYRLLVPSGAVRVRFVRIGYRPLTLRLPRNGTAIDTLDAFMTRIPTMLEPVSVRSNACPRRSDEGSALGLLEQARASLLNSVVSRNANPAALLLIRFDRAMDGTSDRIVHQTVTLDSTTHSTASFSAVRRPADFVSLGFISDESGSTVYLGPDADALLDDAFIAGYCFRLVSPERGRPTEVGLGFAAPSHTKDRVDIDGVLWVDTASRRLRQLEFRYVGLDRSLEPAKPGGWLSFRDMPNGVVLIDRWWFRLPVVRTDSVYNTRKQDYVPRNWLEAQESGGEVARIEWPNHFAWDAPLGTLRLQTFTHAQKPAAGTRVRLLDTDYTARADTNGVVVIPRLLPGPYELVVVDNQLEPLGITLKTPIKFSAARDSVHRAVLDVPTAEDYVFGRCRHDGIWKQMPRRESGIVWMVGRVLGPDKTPIDGISVAAKKGSRFDLAQEGLSDRSVASLRTGTDGVFQLCPNLFRVGDTVHVQVNHRELTRIEFLHKLTDSLTVLPLVREPRRP